MDAVQEQQLRKLVTVFLEENAKVNLSAFRTQEGCWIGNVLDSTAAVELFESFRIPNFEFRILDIGTGGGFPLLPLAICLPEAHLTGMDSTQKKIDAVNRIKDSLGLKNVNLICGRVEVIGHAKQYRETFDVVTARAVAEINVLLEYASPFVKVGGKIILWKSMNAEKEVSGSKKAQDALRCPFKESHIYDLPGDFGKRQLLIFEKKSPLSGTYPRAVGVPKKNPLK